MLSFASSYESSLANEKYAIYATAAAAHQAPYEQVPSTARKGSALGELPRSIELQNGLLAKFKLKNSTGSFHQRLILGQGRQPGGNAGEAPGVMAGKSVRSDLFL